jgi:integrase
MGIKPNAAGYYFWSGASAITTATDNWRKRFDSVFKTAGIAGGHPHRFRDPFAVDLLLRGVPIDQVSVLLGHSSVKITEQHYLPFVAARRPQIADSLRQAWASWATERNRHYLPRFFCPGPAWRERQDPGSGGKPARPR